MSISAGKIAGLTAVSDKYGVIAAVAMDQRSSLKKALGHDVSDEQLEEFKVAVTEILTPNASAVLLDPEWRLARVKFNGVLCGRATWRGGIAVYAKGGVGALRTWLQDEGLKNLAQVTECLKRASPWSTIYQARAA